MRTFNHIAKLVKEKRVAHPERLSQSELSHRLGYKNGQFISNVERGLCSIPLKGLAKLSEVLDIDQEQIKDAVLKDFESTVEHYLIEENDSKPQASEINEITKFAFT